MPRIKSAKKALLVSKRNRSYNKKLKTEIKKQSKKAKKSKKKEVITSLISYADRAAAKKVIHKNKAARIKSRFSKLMNKPKK